MSETMRTQTGHFSWNELMTTDTKAAAVFYGKLFGWQPEAFRPQGTPAGAPPYTLFKTNPNETGLGGMIAAPQPGIPPHWLAYVVVPDADAAAHQAVKLGGKILVPVMAMGEVGRIAVIQDPQGAALGLHELPKPQ